MKYKDIIQELKESPDKNIAAFLEDVEKKKRLSKRERQLYLARLQDPSVADALASDCIPSIIRVVSRSSWRRRCRCLQLYQQVQVQTVRMHRPVA